MAFTCSYLRFIYLLHQQCNMYATASDVQIETYGDLWQKGRYRVELGAELPFDPDDVDNALEKLGYKVIDAGQWGRSYHHGRDQKRSAELDELEEPEISLRLTLRHGDLGEEDIDTAKDQLRELYDGINRMCQKRYGDYGFDSFCLSMYPDSE